MRTPINIPTFLRLILPVMAMLALATCSSDDPVSPNPGGNDPQAVSFGLAVSEATPASEIFLTGLPDSLDLSEVFAVVTEPEPAQKAVASQAYVGRKADGTPYLVTPLALNGSAAGGEVVLTLNGGGITSDPVLMTLLPLPEATATLEDLISNLQELATAWFQINGTTREELRAMDPAVMPGLYWPLWVTHEVLDSPTNPNSLRALVDGPIPYFDNEEADFDIINRLISQAGLVEFLAAEIDTVNALAAELAGAGFALDIQPGKPGSAGGGFATSCIPPGEYGSINDAVSLDLAMRAGRQAASRVEGASAQVLNGWGNVVGVAGLIPPLKVGATAIGGSLYIFQTVNQAAANMLPTSFDYGATDFRFSGDKSLYKEDEVGGHWLEFKVTAVSQGWALDQDILSAIMQIGGLSDAGGVRNLLPDLGDFGMELSGFIVTTATSTAVASATQGGSLLEICPNAWPGIDVSDQGFCKAEIAFGTSFELVARQVFETREPGVSQLKIETENGKFGGTPPTSKTKPLEVLIIEVVVAPDFAALQPDQTQEFSVLVNNANDTSVEWTVPAPLTEIHRTAASITIQAPPAEAGWTSPVTLNARSQASTGARQGKVDSDPRDGGAVVTPNSGSITVTPSNICVPLGTTKDFLAVVHGIEDQSVTWSASNGSFDGNTYHAPGTEDLQVIITATSVANAQITGTAIIEVSDCQCSWSALVTGDYSGTFVGDKAIWDSGLYTLITLTPDENYSDISFSFGPDDSFTGPGTYEVFATALINNQIYVSSEEEQYGLVYPTVNIWSIEGTQIIGTLTGTLSRALAEEPFYAPIEVSIEFRAQNSSQVDPCHLD